MLAAKITRLSSDLDAAVKGRESDAETNGSLLKKIANLEMQISEMTEVAEETARNKANVTLKLRKAEDDAADLRDANDELKQLLEKSGEGTSVTQESIGGFAKTI